METIKMIKIIRVLTIIGLLLISFLSVIYKFNDCQLCEFELEGKKVNAKEVWEAYKKKCLSNMFGNFNFPYNSLNWTKEK